MDNLERNKIHNVTPVNFAVAEETGSQTLYRYKEGNLGRHSLLPSDEREKQVVETITLDRFVENRDIDPAKVRFIKMDIEGYEYFAVRGAVNLLKHVPLILTEYSPEMLKERGFNPTEFLHFMQHHNYQPHQLIQGSMTPIESDKNLDQGVTDIFWVKNGGCER